MKLFWRIFLTFLVTTILMNGFVVFLNEYLPLRLVNEKRQPFQPEVAQNLAREAIDRYEEQGGEDFLSTISRKLTLPGPVYLFDQNGRALENNEGNKKRYQGLARKVLDSGEPEFLRRDLRELFACPIQSASGRRYAIVFTIFEPVPRFQRPRYWLNLAFALLPAALVCALLSFYITRPITALQKTTQRIADGDLEARTSPRDSARSDEFGRLARDFDVMSSRIQGLMKAQRRFVADVSHELGGPLTRMHLALALLKRRSAGADREVERIERETGKLSELVEQLLMLASLEGGKLPTEDRSYVAIPDLTASIIRDASFEAAKRGCRLIVTQERVTTSAYPKLLKRAIENVIRNAIRYAPEGSDILFTCHTTKERKHVLLEVMDSGPGVPESMLTDIFRAFFRTSRGRERGNGGTGLGLAIAGEAISLHHGTITAQNRSGGGLQVTITLPLRLAAEATENSSPSQA